MAAAVVWSLAPAVSFAAPARFSPALGPVSEQSASERAVQSGEAVAVTAATTEYTTTVANPDGTFTLTQSTQPQRARTEDGTWAGIDTTLVTRADGTVGPKNAVVDLSFSGGGNGSQMVRLGVGEKVLGLGWPGTLPKPALAGATATYANVPVDDVDLQLTATAEGYREVLVVKTAQAAASPELQQVRLSTVGEGLSVVPGEGGGVRAVDADGNAVLRGPAGQMWDSAGDDDTQGGPEPQLLRAAQEPQPQSQQESGRDPATPGQGDASAELPVEVRDGSISVVPDQDLLRG
ncbi:hypothetical protein [Streptomyces enissocaesilis]|uniref:Uncharacterized protein n=1 Tax=Streptomyces enissocaesilis TaxID=332589 RepID=A0ABN3WPS2_9ACTN